MEKQDNAAALYLIRRAGIYVGNKIDKSSSEIVAGAIRYKHGRAPVGAARSERRFGKTVTV